MAVIPAAALGALVGTMMNSGKGRKSRLRGTAKARSMKGRISLARAARSRRRLNLTKKQWQSLARRQVAAPRNYSTAKTTESVVPGGNGQFNLVTQNKLTVVPLIDIDKGTNINQRLRDACIVSGIKLNVNMYNREAYRVYANWAVIHPKVDENVSATEADFFRDYTDERSWNAGSEAKTGLSWSCAKINTDKFNVLKRGKFLLAPGSMPDTPATTGTYNLKDCDKDLSIWCKLGRTIMFKDVAEGQVPIEQLYFVFWFSNSQSGAGNGIGTNGCAVRVRAINFFREPKSG